MKKIPKQEFKKMIKEMEQSVDKEYKKCNSVCNKIKTNHAKDKKKNKMKSECHHGCWKKRMKTVKSFHNKYPKEFKEFVKNLGGGGSRKSLRKSRLLSKKNYEDFIKKRQKKKKLTKKQNKDLDHTLFIKYCKCIKNLKYNKKMKINSEYPICISSVYTKRGFKPPKDIKKKCKKYKY